MKVCVYLALFCCLLLHYSTSYGQTPKRNDRPAEWEYKQLESPSDESLNHHAKEGWEIVTAAGGGGDSTRFYRVTLKRHKSHPLFGTKTSDIPEPEPLPQSPQCKLTPAQAPAIRGIHLGVTSDELF